MKPPLEKPIVLFLCSGNSARSQMAEAFLRKLAGDRFEACSAGLDPKGIHPLTIHVMEEVGISLKGQRSKPLSEFLARKPVRYAIIVCAAAEQQCPKIWPFGAEVISWSFEDPAAAQGTPDEQLRKFREVRDQIEARVRTWVSNREWAAGGLEAVSVRR